MTTGARYRVADTHEAIAARDAGDVVYTIVLSPFDGSFWYSNDLWHDATYAWRELRHTQFHRLPDEMRPMFPEAEAFSAGENAMFIQEG